MAESLQSFSFTPPMKTVTNMIMPMNSVLDTLPIRIRPQTR